MLEHGIVDVAEKAAAKARPDEDALRRVEEPAPDAQWIAPDGSSELLSPFCSHQAAADLFLQRADQMSLFPIPV